MECDRYYLTPPDGGEGGQGAVAWGIGARQQGGCLHGSELQKGKGEGGLDAHQVRT